MSKKRKNNAYQAGGILCLISIFRYFILNIFLSIADIALGGRYITIFICFFLPGLRQRQPLLSLGTVYEAKTPAVTKKVRSGT